MTAPANGSSGLPPWVRQRRDSQPESDNMYWEQQESKRAQEQADLPTTTNTPTVDTLDKNYWGERLDATKARGATLLQGEQQSAEVKRAFYEQRRQAKIEQERTDAVERMRQSVADFQEEQQKAFDTRWDEIQKKVDQFGVKLNQAKLIINPGQYSPPYMTVSPLMGRAGGAQGTGGGTPIGQYSNSKYQQIAQWARQAGWDESQIPMVISIAMAESNGNPTAVNTSNSNGSRDDGLMQINSIHSQLRATGDVYNPVDNLRMALQVYKDAGNSWSPWSTYNNGAYEQFISSARPASYVQPVKMAPYNYVGPTGQLRQTVVSTAARYIGVPYKWGGNDLSTGVDCSGLVQQVYKRFGIEFPRRADAQAHVAFGTKTSINSLRPGDLVAWQGGYRGPNYVGHIAIYAGNGEIIEAPHTGATIRRRAIRADEKGIFGVALDFK